VGDASASNSGAFGDLMPAGAAVIVAGPLQGKRSGVYKGLKKTRKDALLVAKGVQQ
jgi:hypothetical protein